VPKKATRIRSRLDRPDVTVVVGVFLLPLGDDPLPLEQAQMVDEEDPIQVVDLMLHGAGGQALQLPAIGLAVLVQRFQDHPVGTGNLGKHIRDGQTALLGAVLARGFHDPRVHHHQLHSLGVDHRHPTGHADLVRGEADTLGRVHGLEQVGDEPADLVVHHRHGCAGLP
jgi:hypothetical protein